MFWSFHNDGDGDHCDNGDGDHGDDGDGDHGDNMVMVMVIMLVMKMLVSAVQRRLEWNACISLG